MLQILLTLLIFLVIIFPCGNYLYKMTNNKKTFADPLFDKVDSGIFKILKIERICIVIDPFKCVFGSTFISSS